MHKSFLLILSFLTIVLPAIHGQSAVLSAGGDASGSGGSAAYSIGQVAYTTHSSEGGSVTLGVQQSYLVIMVGTGEPEVRILASVSPNPTQSSINLEFDDPLSFDGSFSLGLYDIDGKLLRHEKIVSRVTSIQMENFPNAVYFLHVIRNNAEIKVFKIFKTN